MVSQVRPERIPDHRWICCGTDLVDRFGLRAERGGWWIDRLEASGITPDMARQAAATMGPECQGMRAESFALLLIAWGRRLGWELPERDCSF